VISTERLRDVKKVLLTFHTLETVAAHKFGHLLSLWCFSKPQTSLFEDQIETFSYSFRRVVLARYSHIRA
jgi:hypothetical protein